MKIGDKIKCVKLDSGLVLGEKYEVFSYTPTWCGEKNEVITVEPNGPPYYADCFELIKEPSNTKENNMKIGDEIYCINAKESKNLETLAFYKVTDINEYGNIQVKEKETGKTLEHYYKPNRFELAQTTEKVAVSNKIDLSKKYRTRDGLEVCLLAISRCKIEPVLGEFFQDGEWKQSSWTLEGKWIAGQESGLDLVEVPDKIVISCGQCNVEIFNDQSIYVENMGPSMNWAFDKEEMAEIIGAWNSFS